MTGSLTDVNGDLSVDPKRNSLWNRTFPLYVFAVMCTIASIGGIFLNTNIGGTGSMRRPTTSSYGELRAGVPQSPMPYTTSKKIISIAAAYALPIIEGAALQNTFPPMEVSYVTIDAMHFSNFSIKSLKVAMATPSPSNVTVDIVNLKMTIPDTDFVFKYGILKCPGKFRLTLSDTQFTFNVLPYIVNKTLRVAVGRETTNITWGELKIEHDLDSVMCRIGQSIVQVFMGQMDELIEKNIKEQLPIMLPENLQAEANNALENSRLVFSAPLTLTPERAVGQVEMILRTASVEARPRAMTWPWPISHRDATGLSAEELPNRDAAAVLYTQSVTNFLAYAHQTGLLNYSVLLPPEITTDDIKSVFPDAYKLCQNCSIGFGLVTGAAPTFSTAAPEGGVNSVSLHLTALHAGLFLFPKTAAEHAAALRATRRVRSSRACHDPFSMFATSTFIRYSPSEGGRVVQLASPDWVVPVAVFAIDVTLTVSNLSAVGARSKSIQYSIAPLEDFSMSLIASNMGPLDVEQAAKDFVGLANNFVIPLTNMESPYPLPVPIKEGLLTVSNASIIAGFNVSIF